MQQGAGGGMSAHRADGHKKLLQERMLRRQRSFDFLDPAQERRRLCAVAWGTFQLVVVAAGGEVVAARSGGAVTLGMIVVAPGLMVMAIIYFMGTVSGAHLNPAVTMAFAARGNFPWGRAPGYVLAQMIGATVPGHGVSSTAALAMEVLLTAGLVNTILGTASGARNIGANGAIAVGGYIALAGLWAAPISGASMNPARSLAPDLVRGDLGTAWIYVAGPALGALLGVVFEWILKGKPTAAGTIAAEGTLDADDPTRAVD